MQIPRWFLVSSGLLLLNLGLVIATVANRRAVADDQPEVGVADSSAAQQNELPPTPDRDGRNASVAANTPPATDAPPHKPANDDPLSELAVPAELPEVPSLTDPEALKNDPVFQEFRKLFSNEEEKGQRWLADGLGMERQPVQPSEAYFSALDRRLATVENLCTAARQIAAEAGDLASQGNNARSQELLQMATQLRDMAATLLVDKL